MRIRSVSAIILAAAMTVCTLTSCGKKDDSSKVKAERFSNKELAEMTSLYGHKLTYPLTLESLGEDFTIDESTINEVYAGMNVELQYKGESFGYLGFKCSPSELNAKTNIEFIQVSYYKNEPSPMISIDGFQIGDKEETFKAKFGEPDTKNKSYYTSDDGVLMYTSSEGRVMSFSIGFKWFDKR